MGCVRGCEREGEDEGESERETRLAHLARAPLCVFWVSVDDKLSVDPFG